MKNNGYILGIDQGTTGTRTLALNEKWEIESQGYYTHEQYYPKPGWVEHDPIEIWQKTQNSVSEALIKGGINQKNLRAIGLDNQGETVIIWNKNNGKPIYNAIVWQDRRTSQLADELKEKHAKFIKEKTGVVVDSYFSALKIKWILDNVEGAREEAEKGNLIAGTTDTWLIWNMTNGKVHMTDYSTASRTMLLNINSKEWDKDILDLLNIPVKMLPELKNSSEVFGYTDPNSFLGLEIPISGSAVDQQAALFGQSCYKKGMIKTTYGTGCFMLMNTGNKICNSDNGILSTVAWSLEDELTFALDGGVYIAGAAVEWLNNGINIIDNPAETENICKSISNTGEVFFVPAFSGLAAPYWDQYARGTLVGITGGTERKHIVRATLESIAYQVNDNMKVMEEDSGIDINVMRVDGGAVANDFLMQFQADILGIPVDVPEITETTALGAAYLAGLGIGVFDSIDQISNNWSLKKRYEPKMSKTKREYLIGRWKEAVERSQGWAKKEILE
ncbi:glycerol kinase GlpK [Halanaerobium sp.]|uniref:glycerol kinase GlpK n=1 Tax=Halanaerobium sp. TaxID=1895664 RepID=UPI000DE62DB5|nr:glycerol kinase GlpK [Halanaerobium sp.]PUU87132.1 MAG: glycerol kinase [Halanaerobium sp.]